MSTRALCLAAFLPLLACNGSSKVDCSASTSCGGDPTGEWRFNGECLAMNLYCDQATVDLSDAQETLVFSSDHTYKATIGGTARISIPAMCSRDGGPTLS